jgi:hypothetical protein
MVSNAKLGVGFFLFYMSVMGMQFYLLFHTHHYTTPHLGSRVILGDVNRDASITLTTPEKENCLSTCLLCDDYLKFCYIKCEKTGSSLMQVKCSVVCSVVLIQHLFHSRPHTSHSHTHTHTYTHTTTFIHTHTHSGPSCRCGLASTSLLQVSV